MENSTNAIGEIIISSLLVVLVVTAASVCLPLRTYADTETPTPTASPTPSASVSPTATPTTTATTLVPTMTPTPGLVLWSKLGNNAEVQNSQIGLNGLIDGTLNYSTGEYGNGFVSPIFTSDAYTNYIRYDNLALGQQGCIEFWYQPTWSNPSVGYDVALLGYGNFGSENKITIFYNDWQDRFLITFYEDVNTSFIAKYIVPSQTAGWSTTQPFHMAFTWDGTLANNVDKVKIYINGQQVVGFINTIVGNPTFSNWGSIPLSLGGIIGSHLQSEHPHQGSCGVIDNFKISNYPKTDFSDRFYENGMSPTATITMTATRTPTSTITTTATVTPTATITSLLTLTATSTVSSLPTATPRLLNQGGFATPNPFNPARGQKVNFNYDLNLGASTIRIMNVRGRLVRTLTNSNEWDGRNDSGNFCENGLYLYQIDDGQQRVSGQVVLIK